MLLQNASISLPPPTTRTMSTPPPSVLPILQDNPYAGHPELSALEADLLWEYAKMAALVKQVCRNLPSAYA